MLDTTGTWRYQSAVLLGPCPNLPDQPNSGPEEGWGAPFERPFARSVLHGAPAAENIDLSFSSNEPRKSQARSSSSQLLMQASQQVSLLASSATPGFPGAANGGRAFAGVAQLVEHLFCKQVVSGSIPLASSNEDLASVSSSRQSSLFVSETSEGCPSGQREQAVNLPAHAYVGSNPTPSTNVCHGSSAPPRWSESSGAPPQVLGPRPQNSRRVSLARRGSVGTGSNASGMPGARREFHPTTDFAGVTQLVESQFSKLKVDGSSVRRRELSSRPAEVNSAGPHPQVLGPRPQNSRRGSFGSAGVTQLVESQFSKLKVDGSSPFSRSNFVSVSRFSSLISCASRHQTASTSSRQQLRPDAGTRLKPARPASLVAGEAEASTGAERTLVREHRSTAEAQPPAKIAGRRYRSQQRTNAHLAQLVEHVLGKDEVTSSSLVVGSAEVRTVVTIPVRRESESNG